ncbi:sulfotransferase [Paenibacillus harenae]|uniref:sulfotransferase n=1 Tax=Paenibacillus harenae TaxID=306543 RepID=UPI002794E474|nr:sulfotransferase [Paenibacillus harenae]MDQ0058843.1 uncharacterized protein YxeA [Paenibacillus harenae]
MDLILSAATHRSGSTLVQRILNARKETLMWGEHLGIIKDFHHIQRKIQAFSKKGELSRKKYFTSGEDPNQWLALMTPSAEFVEQAGIQSTKAFLDTLYSQFSENHDTIGFKEVRYGAKELSILQKCYPDARFILLVRNPLKAWESYPKKWGEYRHVNSFAKQWNDNVTDYTALAKSNPNAYLIQYEKLIRKEPKTVETLCALAQLTEKELEDVLAQKIRGSSQKKSITAKQAALIKRMCRVNMKRLGYL